MTQPFIWIGIHKIREGKAEELKRLLKEFPDFIEENEPRLLAFNLYLDEEENKVAVVQIHPDADSFEFHMKVAGEHISQSYDFFEETLSTQIYGTPSESVLEMVEQFRQDAGQKETLSVLPQHISGFTRLGNE
jgi:quinol monooxygenase YgiN